jgi:hypothetical protein
VSEKPKENEVLFCFSEPQPIFAAQRQSSANRAECKIKAGDSNEFQKVREDGAEDLIWSTRKKFCSFVRE